MTDKKQTKKQEKKEINTFSEVYFIIPLLFGIWREYVWKWKSST